METEINQEKWVELAGSYAPTPSGLQFGRLDKTEYLTVTLLLRTKSQWHEPREDAKAIKPLTHKQLWTSYGAFDNDISAVQKFAQRYKLELERNSLNQRIIDLRGRISYLEEAFRVDLKPYITPEGYQFVGRSGHIYVPINMRGIILGVFGLDARPFAVRQNNGESSEYSGLASPGFDLTSLDEIFTPNERLKKKRVAVIELVGGGLKFPEITSYFHNHGKQIPQVLNVSIEGISSNRHGVELPELASDSMPDMEWVMGETPDYSVGVYFANNTDKGFLDAINAAVHNNRNKPTLLYSTWKALEEGCTQQTLAAINDLIREAGMLGIAVRAPAMMDN